MAAWSPGFGRCWKTPPDPPNYRGLRAGRPFGRRRFEHLEAGLNRVFATLSAAAVTATLAACGGPDAEFKIGDTGAAPQASTASQAPLYIPPEYALRPGTTPAGPEPRPVPRIGLSAGESRLLTMAGVADADPRIRMLIDQESTTRAVVDPFRIERLVLGAAPTPPPGLSIERTDSRMIADPLSLF